MILSRNGQEHRITAFSKDTITRPVPSVNVQDVLPLLPINTINEKDIVRPVGPVDLLVGIQWAGHHPIRSKENTVGNLGLCESKFGTGWVLEGTHPKIKVAQVNMVLEAREVSRAMPGECFLVSQSGTGSHQANHISGRARKFTFLECEEMATVPPRQCMKCTGCDKCSYRAREMSRRDQEELMMIERNITIDEEKQMVNIKYPYVLF